MGEIFGAGIRLVRAHLLVLGAVALIGNLLSAGAVIAVLSALPDTTAYFSDQWMRSLSQGTFSYPPPAVLYPLAVGAVIGFATTIAVSGLATAFAADDAIGRPATTAAALSRLRGRWLILVAVAVTVAVLTFLGFLAFIIPGLVLLATLVLATPVAVIEKSTALQALRRSAQLSSGSRGRLLGITALAYVIASLIGSLVIGIAPPPATISGALVGLAVQAVISAVTVPWTASVVALLYIDTRIRKENLAAALIRASMRLTLRVENPTARRAPRHRIDTSSGPAPHGRAGGPHQIRRDGHGPVRARGQHPPR